jgi:hypothetical protein
MKIHKIKNLKDIKLSDSEKKNLFNRISDSIAKESPGNALRYPVRSPFFSFSHFLQYRYVRLGTLSIFILLLTSATAFASLDALPGDFLYGVKTNVVEKIPSLFIINPEDQAKDDYKKIETRIGEFEKLAEKGKLTDEKTKTIENNIDKSFSDFDRNVKEIKDKTDTTEGKNRLEKELEDNLEKHTEKIKKIRDEGEQSNKNALQSVLERAHSLDGREGDNNEEKKNEGREGKSENILRDSFEIKP